MSAYTCYGKLLEHLLSNNSIRDYEITRENEKELRVVGKAVREICGTDTAVINTNENVLVVSYMFVGEETGELFTKYIDALKKARILNLSVVVVLDDCDRQLIAYVSALCEVLKLATPQTAFSIATYATLLATHAESVQTYTRAKEDRDKYFEYQLALEKAIHYLNLLVKQLPTTRDVEVLLDVVRRSLKDVVDVKNAFNQVIDKVLGFQLKFAEIYSVKNELAECPVNMLIVAKKFQQRIEAEGRRAYILVPKQVKNFLKDFLPEEILVGI